jgi:hypothetical protein
VTRPGVVLMLLLVGVLLGGLVWFPASLALRALPAPTLCERAAGTVWRGRCDRLSAQGVEVGALDWRLSPTGLLHARLIGSFEWTRHDDRLAARIEAGARRMTVTGLRGRIGLESLRALPLLPPALASRLSPAEGRLAFDMDTLTLRSGRIVAARGTLDGEGLVWRAQERWSIGGMRVTFVAGEPAEDGLQATVRDTGGPLEFAGRLSMVSPPAWTLTGTVRARDPVWAPRLDALGPPDPLGRHALAVEGR